MTAIRVIVELRAQHGQRDELRRSFESMLAQQSPNLRGFLGSVRHEAVGNRARYQVEAHAACHRPNPANR